MGLWDVPSLSSLSLDPQQKKIDVFFLDKFRELSQVIGVFWRSGNVLGVILL